MHNKSNHSYNREDSDDGCHRGSFPCLENWQFLTHTWELEILSFCNNMIYHAYKLNGSDMFPLFRDNLPTVEFLISV